jgi:hypothetical protein
VDILPAAARFVKEKEMVSEKFSESKRFLTLFPALHFSGGEKGDGKKGRSWFCKPAASLFAPLASASRDNTIKLWDVPVTTKAGK